MFSGRPDCPTPLVALSDAKKVRDYVTDVCLKAAPADFADAIKVVFMGQISKPQNCRGGTVLGGNIPGEPWVLITNLAHKGTISHELGHALGLEHLSTGVCADPTNLMCSSVAQGIDGLHTLTADQCQRVADRAKSYHDLYW